MNTADALCREYESVLRLRWPSRLSGDERVWMAVYEPANERRVRARLVQFELATQTAGKKWRLESLDRALPEWISTNRHREALFANPKALTMALSEFRSSLATHMRSVLDAADSETVVACVGAGSLFGYWSVSELISQVASSIKGILLVFFPGRHEGTVYRLLDARSSWNYLALAIEVRPESKE